MTEETIKDYRGREVKVTRIPPRGKAKTLFKKSTAEANAISPFERFKNSNGNRSKCTSF